MLFLFLFMYFKVVFLLFLMQSGSYRRLWGQVKRLESLYPDSNPRGYYPGKFNFSFWCFTFYSTASNLGFYAVFFFTIDLFFDQTVKFWWGCRERVGYLIFYFCRIELSVRFSSVSCMFGSRWHCDFFEAAKCVAFAKTSSILCFCWTHWQSNTVCSNFWQDFFYFFAS